MIKVYHSQRARSARVIWLLEELGVPYEAVTLAFNPETLKSPEFLKLHPLGQVPVVEDGDVRMFESGAILEFLLEKYGAGRLSPAPATAARAEYLTWFHFGEASLAMHMGHIVYERFGKAGAAPSEDILSDSRARLKRAAAVVDARLADRDYICGSEFSAADLMVSYGLIMSRIVRELPAEFTNIAAYMARLKERPAYAVAWA